jgi:hypothetical protein
MRERKARNFFFCFLFFFFLILPPTRDLKTEFRILLLFSSAVAYLGGTRKKVVLPRIHKKQEIYQVFNPPLLPPRIDDLSRGSDLITRIASGSVMLFKRLFTSPQTPTLIVERVEKHINFFCFVFVFFFFFPGLKRKFVFLSLSFSILNQKNKKQKLSTKTLRDQVR